MCREVFYSHVPAAGGGVTHVILAKNEIRVKSLSTKKYVIMMRDRFYALAVGPVHDALDGVDQGVDLAIVPSPVIGLYTPDHGPA